jgi:ribosomal protein S18 acetylase RimI-like enzyme
MSVSQQIGVRPARREDLHLLAGIEGEADQTFVSLFGPLDWDPPSPGTWRMAAPGYLLVAGEPVVGFAHVLEVEGWAHLEQLAVRPSHHRRGIGTSLVRAALVEAAERGYDVLTLCTYADVPWNAPFYRALGFEELSDLSPVHRRMRDHERDLGLEKHGRRVVMSAPTST